MSDISPTGVFKLLGEQEALTDSRYFVGRDMLVDGLSKTWQGPKRGAAWLYGSKRVGKSSVASELERRAATDGAKTVTVDASDHGSGGLDAVLSEALCRLGEPPSPEPRVAWRQVVERLCADGRGGLLLVVDEFDKVAVGMRTPEQAYLRKLIHEQSGFGAVFVTCMYPQEVMEEVPDVASRLLGICTLERVQPLKRQAVKDLTLRISSDLPRFPAREAELLLWEHAGGLPAVLKCLARRVAMEVCDDHEEWSSEDLRALIVGEYPNLTHLLRTYWGYLHPKSRSVLLGRAEEEEHTQALREDGLFHRRSGASRPLLLTRWASEQGADADLHARTEVPVAFQLGKLVAEINEALHRKKYVDGFQTGNTVLRAYHLVRGGSEQLFIASVDYLYMVFFEGARMKGEMTKRYRLPEPLATQYRSAKVVGDISDLRNYFDHNQDRPSDGEKRNGHHREAGMIFERRCHCSSPRNADDWIQARDTLLLDLEVLLREVLEGIEDLPLRS